MCRILIFGGTTEGRKLTEYCAENNISVCVSVATDYGAELLPQSSYIKPLIGKLDRAEIAKLISEKKFSFVIDATHPFAELATQNIRLACEETKAEYYRLIRKSEAAAEGKIFDDMSGLIDYLNAGNKRILSTLGSKELPRLSGVSNCFERVWLRVLPVEGIIDCCKNFGFNENKIFIGKGPFSLEDNIAHIEKSGAEILVTKESGTEGGYPEKVMSAKRLGIELVTIKRPVESGFGIDEIKKILREKE